MSDIFKILDYILKKTPSTLMVEGSVSPFILNRWLSMSDINVCRIINSTTNRWITHKGICNPNSHNSIYFLRKVLPKVTKKFSYLKKTKQKEESKQKEEKVNFMEISCRELEEYDELIDFLNKETK
jgi:hypothetical protein